MFTATKKEWCELYAFFRLLADGQATLGTADAKAGDTVWPVAMVQRTERDGKRNYYIEKEYVRAQSEDGTVIRLLREDVATAATLILAAVKEATDNEVASPDGVEEFLDEAKIYDLEAQTDDRTDLSVAFWHPEAPLCGLVVRSRLSVMNPLLEGSAANLKLEQSGIKFANPTVNKINAVPEGPNEVADRMGLIERLGGVLKYADVADRVFRCNLLMMDLHFPRLLAEMVRTMHLEGITRTSELVEVMKQRNPLKIKDELIQKHRFYEYKVKQFLLALMLGMRPAKIYTGQNSAVEGVLLLNGDGELLCYHKEEEEVMGEFLLRNTRLEKGSLKKDKYGYLERENGTYYFKLNARIGWVRR
ncbi:MAG: HpaII family restriction endonuclease [Mediterranea sp.]|jgi:type II restriction enzyme|nr:HpaII family restriction endonuclease [Mediterranea sp.]